MPLKWVGFALLCLAQASWSDESGSQFIPIIPTAEQETAYVWRNLQDIPFFEKNGYQVSLPRGELIEQLKVKARSRSLEDADYAALSAYMADHVYRAADYQAGYEKTVAATLQLDTMLAEVLAKGYPWDFRVFDEYKVFLTLYGPGGSYDPDNGVITLYTTSDGRFRQYDSPLNTLIHEVVHMGIEASIVQRYQVPHPLKERIVDLFVQRHFGQSLQSYRIQRMGDANIDAALPAAAAFAELPEIVEKFLEQ